MPSPSTLLPPPRLLPIGDSCLQIEFGRGVDPAVNRRACAFAGQLKLLAWPFVIDLVPSFTGVGLHYRPEAVPRNEGLTPLKALQQLLQAQLALEVDAPGTAARVVEIPVCYGGEHGPDLEDLAQRSGLSVRELIAQHSGIDAHVFMLGFAPGLPYIGLWGEAFDIPRRDSPRTFVPAGSVAIANRQCVIYPFDLPGGWHLIGRTPLTLFAPDEEPPALLSPGDQVRFAAITAREFDKMAGGPRP